MTSTDQSVDLVDASAAQTRMWMAHQHNPDSQIYHVWCVFDVDGPLEVPALTRAATDLVRRHEPLRTTFTLVGSELQQVIADVPAVTVTEHRGVGDPESTLVDLALADFDLSTGPLWRIAVVESSQTQSLLISMHHIIIDGWSLNVFTEELAEAYRARRDGHAPNWEELELQYADYSAWEAEQPTEIGLAWWRERLADRGPAAGLPLDRLRVAPPDPAAEHVRWRPDADLAERLAQLARTHHTSAATVVQAAWSMVLAGYAGADEVLMGMPTSGRTRAETQRMLGLFVNTVPIRLVLPGRDRPFTDLLVETRNTVADALEHQNIPLEDIVSALQPARDEARTPLFDTLFTVQNTGSLTLDLAGTTCRWRDLDLWKTRFDLEVNVWDHPDLHGLLVFRRSVLDAGTVQQLLDALTGLLRRIALDPSLTLQDLIDSLPTRQPAVEPPHHREVRQALLAGPEVVDAVVVSAGDTDPAAVAFVVSQSPITDARLRRRLEDLPTPVRAVVPVAGLPRHSDGRLDLDTLGAQAVVDVHTFNNWPNTWDGTPLTWRLTETPAAPRPALPWPAAPTERVPSDTERATADSDHLMELSELDGGPALDLPHPSLWPSLIAWAERGRSLVLIDSEGSRNTLAGTDLVTAAERCAAALDQAGVPVRDPLVVAFEENRDFLPFLWAGLRRGTPIVPWNVAASQADPAQRVDQISACLGPCTIVSTAEVRRRLPKGFETLPAETLRDAEPTSAPPAALNGDDVALLLLTSGSTGIPKAVQLTHRMIQHRSLAHAAASGIGPDDISLNWMPLDHVGGVVMFHIRDVVLGTEQIQASTPWVLSDPLRWMQLAYEYGVTSTWAPNFAAGLVADEAHRLAPGQWDLSRLRHVLNGGEAVLSETVRRFVDAMSEQGLPRDAVRPSWGMSETSSGETDGYRADAHDWTDPVPVGPPVAGFCVRVVDADHVPVPVGEVGALEVSGASVTPGYWNNDERNREAFTRDGWFRTGDRAIVRDGELLLVGRDKDEITINGINVSCDHVESVVEAECEVVPAHTVAVGVRPEGGNSEQLLVLATPADDVDTDHVATQVRTVLRQVMGLQAMVALVRAEDIPKTGIGKRQRMLLRDRFLDGDVKPLATLGVEQRHGLPDQFHIMQWRPVPSAVEATSTPACIRVTGESWPQLDDWFVTDPQAQSDGMVAIIAHRSTPSQDHRSAAVTSVFEADRIRREVLTAAREHTTVVVLAEGLWPADADSDPRGTGVPSSMLPGLLRSLDQEVEGTTVRLVVVDEPTAEAVTAEVLGSSTEPEVWLRGADRMIRRLTPVPPVTEIPDGIAMTSGVPDNGLVVVTGGLGGVAEAFRPRLLDRSGPVAFVGRRSVDEANPWWPAGSAHYRQLDVCEPDAVRATLTELEATTGAELAVVLHLAASYAEEDPGDPDVSLRSAMWNKVVGAGTLLDALAEWPRAQLVLASSVAGTLGAPGAAGYAAANSFCDGLVGLGPVPTRSIAWTMWHEVGMSSGYRRTQRTEDRGSTVQSPDQAAAATAHALGTAHRHLLLGLDDRRPWTQARTWGSGEGVTRVEVSTTTPVDTLPPVTDALHRSVPVSLADPASISTTAEPPRSRTEGVVLATWQDVLGPMEGDRTTSFFDLGGTSVQLSRVHGLLGERLGVTIDLVELFRHHTVRAMAKYLDSLRDGTVHDADRAADGAEDAGASRGQRRAAARRARGGGQGGHR